MPRSWLLYKPSLELAELLAERCKELLEVIPEKGPRLDTIREALDTVWTGLTATVEEPARWRRLGGKLKRQLRGGRK